jgi:hypothetical protein
MRLAGRPRSPHYAPSSMLLGAGRPRSCSRVTPGSASRRSASLESRRPASDRCACSAPVPRRPSAASRTPCWAIRSVSVQSRCSMSWCRRGATCGPRSRSRAGRGRAQTPARSGWQCTACWWRWRNAARSWLRSTIARGLTPLCRCALLRVAAAPARAASGSPHAAGRSPCRARARFTDVIADTIDARIYLGIPFRAPDEQAAELGKDVAHWLEKHYFGPRSEPGSSTPAGARRHVREQAHGHSLTSTAEPAAA